MNMSAKQSVINLTSSMGASVEYGGKPFEIVLDAPTGYVWNAIDLHTMVYSQWDSEPTINLWKHALKDMQCGISKCNNAECDTCNNPAPDGKI